jgi:hypothetical protein
MAVATFWFALYSDFPMYPPGLDWPLAVAAIFFLSGLTLLHRLHGSLWPGIAQFGFAVSVVGLVLWFAGGAMNALGLRTPGLLAQPQPGWGLFCVGLIPIGLGAITRRMSLPTQLLLPLGCLFFLGPPLKYLLSERTGGLIVLVGFGLGWLAIGALLLREGRR